MIITKKAIPRRTVLRGLGATLALPLLDGMVPAVSAIRNTPARGMRRFGVLYVPNGMAMQHWTPKGDGSAFDFSPILQPMVTCRDRTLVLTGLNPGPGGGARTISSVAVGRASASATFDLFPCGTHYARTASPAARGRRLSPPATQAQTGRSSVITALRLRGRRR